MNLWMAVVATIIALAGFLLLLGFVNACVAKAVTGKWPHQSKKSKAVYDSLNHVGQRHE